MTYEKALQSVLTYCIEECGKMDAFLICERCADELKHWITGDELEDDE